MNHTPQTPPPRLNVLWSSVLQHRLTLCVAPAGYGKSDLINRMVESHQDSAQFTLLHLTQADSDPQTLKRHLAQTLQGARTGSSEPLETLLTDLGTSRSVVIFDGFEKANTPENGQLLQQWLTTLPDSVSLLIASRAQPDFSFKKLLISGEAKLLGINDLKCQEPETELLLKDLVDSALLTDEVIECVQRVTEGWPLAIRVCGLLMQQQSNTQFLHSFSGRDQYVSDYFHEQVMKGIPKISADLCARLCLFEEFSLDLFQALTGGENSHTQLHDLYRDGLFIESLNRENTQFRFHPLFRDFIAASPWQLNANDQSIVFQRAADWAIQAGHLIKAIDYLILAGNYNAATVMLNESAQTFIRDQGLLPKLIHWCEKVPLSHSLPSINLHFWLAWAFTFSGLFDQAKSNIQQLNRLLKQTQSLTRADLKSLQSRIESITLALAIFQDRSDWTFPETEKWLNLHQKHADPFDIAVVASARFLSARLLLKTTEAQTAIGDAKHIIPRANSLYGSMWIRALDGLSEMEYGDQRVASKLLLDAHQGLSQSETQVSPIRSTIALLCAKACYEQGDIHRARELLPEGLVHIHQHGLTESAAAGIRLEFYLALHQGHDQARFILGKAEFLAARYTPRLLFVVRKLRIELLLQEGDLDAALLEARLAGIEIDDQKSTIIQNDVPLIVNERTRLCALLNFHLGRVQEGLSIVDTLMAQDSTPQRPLFFIETLIVHSALLLRDGHTQRALRQLTRAFKVALQHGVYQTFIDHQEYIEPPLQELLLRRQRDNILIEDQLILRLEQDMNLSAEPDSSAQKPVDLSFSDRERELIQLLPSALSVQKMADYLFVSKATIKTHLHNIYRKLGVNNRTGAIEQAKRYRLLE